MHFGRCQEMGDLLDWLRAHNASSSEKTRFYGLDLPGSSATLGPVLEIVSPYVESVAPGFHPRLTRLRELAASFASNTIEQGTSSKIVFAGTLAIRQYVKLPAADRNELTALLADTMARFDAHRRTYVEHSDAARYDLVRQHLRVAAQLDLQLRAVAALMAGDAAACEANIRDATMADTVQWILGREQRGIVLAHNGHIQRIPIATPTGTAANVDTVGVHLAHRLGNRYLTIGTTCGGGDIIAMRTVTNPDGSYDSDLVIRDLPPADADTIDSVLDYSLAHLSLLDLRTLGPESASAIDAAHRMRMQDQIVDIDVRRAFDMLIHVPCISLWRSPLNAELPDLRDGNSSER